MKTKKVRVKQGFTIVELVIVIGVIGVLSAVLIPTFVNLNNKANAAADESLVKNLNTQLRIKEQMEGKNQTMTDALADAAEAGYIVERLTPKGNKDIVWDQEKDEFTQFETVPTSSAYKYWTIAKSASDLTKGYSSYLYYQPEGSVTVNTGFDAGDYTGINVSYVHTSGAAQEVIIRTNGTGSTLTVNAPSDTVHHFDFLDDLTVTAVAGASYHEHGTVRGKAVISQGHIEVEKGAQVSQVRVESATGAVKVTANESTLINVDTASASNTSVVSNSKDVFVDGVEASAVSGTQSSSVVYPTEIDTEAKLKNLLDNGGLAKLTANIALTQDNYTYVRSTLAGGDTEHAALGTNKSVALNLNGHTITGEALADDLNFIAVDNNGSMKVYDDSTTKGRIIANAKMFYVRGDLEILSGEYVSTVLTAGTDFRSMIIADQNANVAIRDGKFYTPKCVMTSWGNVTIDGGEFVCASASTGWNDAKGQSSYAYAVRLSDGVNAINGGNFYGLHGAISVEGGKSTLANVYAEASEETLAKFGAYVEAKNIKIHVLNNRSGEFLVDSAFVTEKKASFKSSVHYGLYSAGESNVVYTTVNSGTFKSSDKYGAYIGNNNDGGKGMYSHVTINDGTFVGATGKAAVYETGITISYGAGYTEIFGGNFSTDVTSLMKDTVSYQCVKQSDNSWKVSKR